MRKNKKDKEKKVQKIKVETADSPNSDPELKAGKRSPKSVNEYLTGMQKHPNRKRLLILSQKITRAISSWKHGGRTKSKSDLNIPKNLKDVSEMSILIKKKNKNKKKHIHKNLVSVPFPNPESHPGRPRPRTPQEHGFSSDYEQSVYINPSTLSIQRYKTSRPLKILDEYTTWHTFKVPHKSPSGSTALTDNTDAEKELRTIQWVTKNINNVQTLNEEEEMMSSRIKELMDIPPEDYLNVLHEIRFRRDQQRHSRHKKRKEILQQIHQNQKKLEQKQRREETFKEWKNKWKNIGQYSLHVRFVIFWHWFSRRVAKCYRGTVVHNWKKFGFYDPTSAIVLHNFSCFILLMCGTIGLLIDVNELLELDLVLWGAINGPITTRTLSHCSFVIVILAGVLGLVGAYFKRGSCMLFYLLLFIIGWAMFFATYLKEKHFAVEDGIQRYMTEKIAEYLRDPKTHDDGFMNAIQIEFECCGAKGPKDYGYNGTVVPGGKFDLPKSCCNPKSHQYREKSFKDCYISNTAGYTEIPNFVSYSGCAEEVKLFLSQLYSFKTPLIWLMGFATGTTLLTFLNINYHLSGELLHKKEKRHHTTGELFLKALEDSTTSAKEFELESIPGTIDSIRKRLADCETLNDFVTVIVEIIHEVEFVQDMDPTVLARVILGLRPRRHLPQELLGDKLQQAVLEAPKVKASRIKLAQQDLYYRYLMHTDEKTLRQKLELQNEMAEVYPKMIFPLPRPLKGVREVTWTKLQGNIVRTDRVIKEPAKDKDLSPTDPQYLETERVIIPPEPWMKNQSLWKKLTGKVFPPTDHYTFVEEEQFRPQLKVLTHIIEEAQGMLRDLGRKTMFMKKMTTDDQTVAEHEYKLNQAAHLLYNTAEDSSDVKPQSILKRTSLGENQFNIYSRRKSGQFERGTNEDGKEISAKVFTTVRRHSYPKSYAKQETNDDEAQTHNLS